MKIAIINGTRPEVIKHYPLYRSLKERNDVDVAVLHTNQHFYDSMSGIFYNKFGYSPDYIMPGGYSLGNAINWISDVIKFQGIDICTVLGDTSTALAGALAAMYSDIKIAHIEAGLRSFDKYMYEERNRMMIDDISHYLFCYLDRHADFLANVRGLRGDIFVVGNVMVDVITDLLPKLEKIDDGDYIYVTLHRKEFTDSYDRMNIVFSVLNELSKNIKIIFPLHPRTKDWLKKHKIKVKFNFIEPVDIFQSLSYIKSSKCVITDSGGIQEEACILGVPCVTVRENTERQETVECGANVLTGFDYDKILSSVYQSVSKKVNCNIYGDYGVGNRIVNNLIKNYD